LPPHETQPTRKKLEQPRFPIMQHQPTKDVPKKPGINEVRLENLQ
jgi:hypothetical protein